MDKDMCLYLRFEDGEMVQSAHEITVEELEDIDDGILEILQFKDGVFKRLVPTDGWQNTGIAYTWESLEVVS